MELEFGFVPTGTKDLSGWDVASHGTPTSDIHYDYQFGCVYERQHRSEEQTQPNHSLIWKLLGLKINFEIMEYSK